MGRAPCCAKVGLHRGPWSTKEDVLLTNYIQAHGEGQWRSLPKKAGLLRCGKSCRLRWMNYLRPGIKRGNITPDEEDLIIRLHTLLGNRWSLIAGRLPGRTDNEIKNYWNTHLIKRLQSAGTEAETENNVSKSKKKKQGTKKPNVKGNANNSTKSKQKKPNPEDDPDPDNNNDINSSILPENKLSDDDSGKEASELTKVFLPRPIRISPGLSRNESFECSSGSLGSSSDEVEKEGGRDKLTEVHQEESLSYMPWPSLLELEDLSFGENQVFDEVLYGGDILSLDLSVPASDGMLEMVYDEYLQLL